MTRQVLSTVVLAGLVLGAAGCARPVEVRGTIESLSIDAQVRPDGGLDVREVLRIVPDGGVIDLRRTMGSPYADGIAPLGAWLDGRAVVSGAAGFRIEPLDAGHLIASWQRAVQSTPVVAQLDYRLTSVVGVRRPRGQLEWPVLVAGRPGGDVGSVTIALRVPDAAHVYDGTGMAEAGWTVEVTGAQVRAARARVAAEESATVLAVFDVDRSRVQQGQWEWNLDRQEQYRPALISAGLFILVIGAGILALLRVQYPPASRDAAAAARRAIRTDRQMLARGLRLTAIVGGVMAGTASVVAARWLAGLGAGLQVIPASLAVVSAWFAAASWWYRRSARGD